ncbi:ABC transporter ATP-binding protein [Pusillimonas noertemannii]|uniref:Branched-chain amino acid transport system ATP-binding protein n=1 Tax=Pusillimonas noertemannii TaxID=305977 RepID=A0A2U1CRA2_9BURK|nr:ABC transporter ATP-binding protein [Pusillimonas noertemannii]NYT67692.1 ABC transporter ATP-binding protein [Pusillimonas noertemannii]PVY68364.1 branched-chain amino acid transport system ATP-binding protein [Pusillimonas noertemannii]TFL12149.1 ABC transporter ATP-binding protein [Pusillimonas noertemannii]
MPELLTLQDVTAGYGDATIIEDISLSIQEGASLAVLGRNGVGKTTLLRTLLGATRQTGGAIHWRGDSLEGADPVRRARMGMGWVPQQRGVFRSLTVEENLSVVARPGHWNLDAVWKLFPRLNERKYHYGDQLSGGEQQMLAIGRALMTNPALLLLDEPLEGLAPLVAEEVAAAVQKMAAQGTLTALVVEQHPIVALKMTTQAIVLERGRICHRARSEELAADEALLDSMLGVA